MMNQSGIYEIVNTMNGKRYIGSSTHMKNRGRTHYRELRAGVHVNQILQRAWNKYSESAFKFLPVLTCQKSMLLFYEQQLLDKVKPEYNICTDARAPMTGRKHTPEALLKIAAASKGNTYNLGNKASPETLERLSKAKKGVLKSEEHKAKIGNAHRGKIVPEHIRLGMLGNTLGLGHVHSAETRAKISAKKKGQTHSEETKALISRKKKGVTLSEERRRALSVALRSSDAVKASAKRRGAARVGATTPPDVKAKQSEARRAWWAARKAAGADLGSHEVSTGRFCAKPK